MSFGGKVLQAAAPHRDEGTLGRDKEAVRQRQGGNGNEPQKRANLH